MRNFADIMVSGEKMATSTAELVREEEPVAYDEYDSARTKQGHLNESEALERYRRVKQLYPEAIVKVVDLPCNHYELEVYISDSEKTQFYRSAYESLVNRALKGIRGALSRYGAK